MSCDAIIICHKAMTGNIYCQQISQGTWDYLIEKSYIRLYQWEKCTKLPYLCIYHKLIDSGLEKYMFCDAIISIDKSITGNIYCKGNLLVICDYLIEKTILDCINDKNPLNYLIYVFIRSQ